MTDIDWKARYRQDRPAVYQKISQLMRSEKARGRGATIAKNRALRPYNDAIRLAQAQRWDSAVYCLEVAEAAVEGRFLTVLQGEGLEG